MYRPGGFPEYSPKDQKIFDTIQDIIRTVFVQRNFQHIWTPAVEKNDILLKGGDTVANEIFGLIGLKDFERGELERSKKDYSLHFDLTVPFARYTLDHLSELTFPFKRYQMQPVWRGERQQRGRFKEFWQCDVDSIWKSGTKTGYRYAVETISTLQAAIDSVFKTFHIDKAFVTHVSHIGLTKRYLSTLLGDDQKVQSVIELLDKFYKKDYSVFIDELVPIVGKDNADSICYLIQTKDYTILQKYDIDAFDILHKTILTLQQLGGSVVYDLTIVRGLGYYTDIVFETFIENEISLGSICSGGGYEDFTKFIDPKNVFSGIGGSIGLSRLMELITDQESQLSESQSYMFLNFADTFDSIILLYKRFLIENRICELYPIDAKFVKQLEYADKKGINYVVILGSSELEKGEYQIKNLKNGEITKESL